MTTPVLSVTYDPRTLHVRGDAFKEVYDTQIWRDDYRRICGRETRCGDIILHSDAKFAYTDFTIDIISPKGHDGWWWGYVSYLDYDDPPTVYHTMWYNDPAVVASLIDQNLRRLSNQYMKHLAKA